MTDFLRSPPIRMSSECQNEPKAHSDWRETIKKSLFKSPSRGTTTAITVVVPGLYQQMIWRSLIPQDTVQDCSHNFFPNITYDAHFSDFMYPTMYAHKVLKIITKSIFVFS